MGDKADIEHIRFYGDTIQAVREGEQVWVVIKRVCEALGIDDFTQGRKLKGKPWATTSIMLALAEDGKNRELFCLALDSLPMWLATIEPARVKPEVRDKLIAYQRECARVLRDHFFGHAPVAAVSPAVLTQLLEQQSQTLVLLRAIVEKQTDLERRVCEVERPSFDHGAIPRGAYLRFQSFVRQIAQSETSSGRWKAQRAATADIHRELREATGWGGKAKPWHLLPAQLEQPVMAVLRRRMCEAERLAGQLAGSRQTHFGFVSPGQKAS